MPKLPWYCYNIFAQCVTSVWTVSAPGVVYVVLTKSGYGRAIQKTILCKQVFVLGQNSTACSWLRWGFLSAACFGVILWLECIGFWMCSAPYEDEYYVAHWNFPSENYATRVTWGDSHAHELTSKHCGKLVPHSYPVWQVKNIIVINEVKWTWKGVVQIP